MLADDDRLDLLRALHVIGEAQDISDFARRLCRELLRLVPAIRATYNEVNGAANRSATVVHPEIGPESHERNQALFERHMHDNPIIKRFESTGETGVMTWAELDPGGEFFDTALYREFYAPAGIHSQIAFMLPAPPGIHVAIVISRDHRGFTDRDRILLSELRLHLVNLYRLVSHAEASRQRDAALADDGWSVVLVDNAGTVLESNAVAEAIGRASGVDLGVGAGLADGPLWSAMSDPTADRWASSRPAAPTKVRGGQVPFEARLLRSPVGPHVLWIREPSRVTAQDARALGLTTRQAQVALLLVDGLTNDQIARRLRISASTVRRHLEAVFERLGVPSRAAAVGRLRGWSGARTPSGYQHAPRPGRRRGSVE
jgi:DNA-binding CsgD family transcriptional regulator